MAGGVAGGGVGRGARLVRAPSRRIIATSRLLSGTIARSPSVGGASGMDRNLIDLATPLGRSTCISPNIVCPVSWLGTMRLKRVTRASALNRVNCLVLLATTVKTILAQPDKLLRPVSWWVD